MYRVLATASALLAAARAQQVCTLNSENKPSLNWSKCTSSGCNEVRGSVVVDANWRWTHLTTGATNCYTGNKWDTSICTSGEVCAEKCCLDGADYAGTYGVTSSGNQLNLKFVTNGPHSKNVGSRLYLMEDENTYQMFQLLGNEFTFDVDVSNIGCGLNGALYFVNMDEDGGKSRYSGNKAGAKYGTGYCDSQCPRDVKFINGIANSEGWQPSASDPNAGIGQTGTCCPEMDIWEANSISTAYTPHPCLSLTQTDCKGDACGGTYSKDRYAGTCDPDGCDFNPYRQGNRTYYGRGSNFNVDTTKKMTVVTQFHTSGGSLSEIRRLYVQNGKVIANSESKIAGNPGSSLTQDFCNKQKGVFGDPNDFNKKGGWSGMSDALEAPMVLVLSLWHDHYANMLWLDSTYPKGATNPGAARGSCSESSGVPADLERDVPNSSVSFSNIKFGPIGSTYSGTGNGDGSTTTQPGTPGPSNPPTTGTVPQYGQCGGINHTGPTACRSPYTCRKINDFYHQCL
ncbi:hypothetical protein F66182_2885 [Fusarium sp. NRRL 66182]|nr:hypothetical protein F66182_2885 [Fusarium sp. NRRL 66182]